MNKYIEGLKDYLAQQKPDYGYFRAHSLLEHLWCSYTENNPIESEKLSSLHTRMDPIFEMLSIKNSDTLFSAICDLCTEHEHISFMTGLHVGVRLVMELQKL